MILILILDDHNGHHGCYLALKNVSNSKKAKDQKSEKECIQFIDFIVVIPCGIIVLNYILRYIGLVCILSLTKLTNNLKFILYHRDCLPYQPFILKETGHKDQTSPEEAI